MISVIEAIIDLIQSWRLYLCVLIGIGIGTVLENALPEEKWSYFLIIPIPPLIIALGFRWEIKKDIKLILKLKKRHERLAEQDGRYNSGKRSPFFQSTRHTQP